MFTVCSYSDNNVVSEVTNDVRFYSNWILSHKTSKPACYSNSNSEYYDEPITYYHRSHAWSHYYDFSMVEKSADMGCPQAQFLIGIKMYELSNLNEAKSLFTVSSEFGCYQSYGYLGRIYFDLKDYYRSIEYFQLCYDLLKTSNSDDLLSCIPFYEISRYFYSQGTSASYDNAVLWSQRGSDLNDYRSMFILALCYYYGKGVNQSYESCRHYLELVIQSRKRVFTYDCFKGDEDIIYGSFYYMGLMYYHGYGVDQSYYEAASYFILSSDYCLESQQLLFGEETCPSV